MAVSIIYRNINIYRLVMNVLYLGKYNQRFKDVFLCIDSADKSVLDLCFGDTYIAEKCKKNKIKWTGFDINEHFVKYAVTKGYNASVKDIILLTELPQADVCIMSGSLYHFYPQIEVLLKKMLSSAPKIIISEPIVNLSSQKGIVGKLAHFFSNAGKGNESFRFDETSFKEMLNTYQKRLNFDFKIISIKRDILVVIRNK